MGKNPKQSKSAQRKTAKHVKRALDVVPGHRLLMWQRVFATYIADIHLGIRAFQEERIDEVELYAILHSVCYLLRAIVERENQKAAADYAEQVYTRALQCSAYDKRIVGQDPPIQSDLDEAA